MENKNNKDNININYDVQKEFKKYREQANRDKWELEEENIVNSRTIDDLLVMICGGSGNTDEEVQK